MTYQIIWNHEVIDTVYDAEEATQLLKEYRMAFDSDDVYIRVVY